MKSEIYLLYKRLASNYGLSNYDIRKLWGLIAPITEHLEFKRRCKAPYFHHDIKTLGEHIISDTIVTYKKIKKIKTKCHDKIIRLDTAVYIAMFHDLYEKPWQNALKKKKFKNRHGFVHPIEAAINAMTWYPEYFDNKETALIIVDGIIHHMYPLPVRTIDGTNMELNIQKKYDDLPEKFKKMIIASTKIGSAGCFSLRKTFFLEGRIMSRADKEVSLKKDLKDVRSYFSLVSGHNKKVKGLVESELQN